jgi:predicted membrane-bound spermidine synthase
MTTASAPAAPSPSLAADRRLPRWMPLPFFASGFAALVYQVVWQRALYAIFGINIESVTVVVTAFLTGLGIGSIAGGALSRSPRRPALLLFSALELSIAAFGFVSLGLFRRIGDLTLPLGDGARSAVMFVVILLPTLLMGATLPLLVAHAVRRTPNVGGAVGMLYFVNTAGSALAALASVLVLMPRLGEHGSVAVAALANLAVGGGLLVYARRGADA